MTTRDGADRAASKSELLQHLEPILANLDEQIRQELWLRSSYHRDEEWWRGYRAAFSDLVIWAGGSR